jgi:hypothetical protein
MRNSFADAANYVDNTAGDIAEAVRDLRARNPEMRESAGRQILIGERYFDNATVQIKDFYLNAEE